MSLPVPLTVRIGNQHVTLEVEAVTIRKEAIGGVRSIGFTLARPLSELSSVAPLSKVYIYDGRSAEVVAEARLADPGRSADANGERWDCVAFGPAQHASDITTPLIYVDRSHDGWAHFRNWLLNSGAEWSSGTKPTDGTPGLMSEWASGTVVPAGMAISAMRYHPVAQAQQKIARFSYTWVAGVAFRSLDAQFSTGGTLTSVETGTADLLNTTGGTRTLVVGTDFTLGRDVIDLRTWRNAGTSATVSADDAWAHVVPVVETVRMSADGTEITTGYAGYAYAHQVVGDLVGRLLPEFDGSLAKISTGGSFQIQQMAYPDGVTPEQVLADLMALEPAYRWHVRPTDAGLVFSWELWPTTVRYEATLDDGGSFPLSTQEVYNEVVVRWVDEAGRTRTQFRTMSCPLLDDLGLHRRAFIDLGSDVGTVAQANQAGDAFLDDHNVPKNAGTLTVARPIRDVITGRMMEPWQIEAGELIRVIGVEAYPDAFNADANDGNGVFRIHAVDYNSDSNAATLALDSDPRDTETALVKLMNRRNRSGG